MKRMYTHKACALITSAINLTDLPALLNKYCIAVVETAKNVVFLHWVPMIRTRNIQEILLR